ncbi:hypothetical protein BGW36DRAFT_361663 [Talaromyces proteolyticus]|uniref:F-box domain-containing protein n=1 Tax=Talaromyces proteolyticus TaxID=1131652 RepID=A0AAD4KR89_9EURO|nr:uncharacterized protein BGW36DRAFT_361663 [Talaromyces proteolyticus]KAH8693827.1 hypothetical protein BGW36DRAFT_361663 [Talaromyces proteolyticus]
MPPQQGPKSSCIVCGFNFRPDEAKIRALYPAAGKKIVLTEVGAKAKPRQVDGLYLFHDQCWGRIMDHFCPREFDLASFYQALLPVAAQSGQIFWRPGDDYQRQYKEEIWHPNFVPFTTEQLINPAKEMPKFTDTVGRLANKTDIFRALPVELCEMVAVHLPTRDYFVLRSVSRAMVPIFSSTNFWRSRFLINEERGYLHYMIQRLANYERNQIDWRLLYHCTCKWKYSQQLDFLIKIWQSLRWLRDATLAIKSNISTKMLPAFRGRALRHYHNSTSWFENTRTESVDIDSSLSEIAISVVKIDDITYVTGLKFSYDDRPDVLIGYTAPGATTMDGMIYSVNDDVFEYPGVQFMVKVSHLLGFWFKLTSRGLHGFVVLQRKSGPAGVCGDETIEEEYAIFLDEVTKIIVTLDHCKITNLGIIGMINRTGEVQGLQQDYDHLLDHYSPHRIYPS